MKRKGGNNRAGKRRGKGNERRNGQDLKKLKKKQEWGKREKGKEKMTKHKKEWGK